MTIQDRAAIVTSMRPQVDRPMRWRTAIGHTLPLLLVATLAGQLFELPAAAAPRPQAQRYPSVPGVDGDPRPTPTADATAVARTAPTVLWPTRGSTEVDLSAGYTQAGTWPVSVSAAGGSSRSASAGPQRVRIEVLDTPTGRAGLLLRVTRTDGVTEPGPASLEIDYRGFRDAAGGGWASRLQLIQLPACAMTDPTAPTCSGTPLAATNNLMAGRIAATVDVAPDAAAKSGGGTVLLLTAGPTSDAGGGDFAATPLKPSATWTGGGSSGDFSWSYPLRVPPAPTDLTPSPTLTYSSQAVDGHTAASNNQPSWVGEGFHYAPPAIQRSYRPCRDDGQAGSYDLCWAGDNATLSLPGHTGELIQDGTNPALWHVKDDDGTRVEKLTGAANGDGGTVGVDGVGEYWKVTTTDGTQYFFGQQRLPGWVSPQPETQSVFTVPVFGNHTGTPNNEPCHQATFGASHCPQAYQWNIDYVVDPNGNSMSYWYAKETNFYARNGVATNVSAYVRAGYLSRIEYGTHRRATDGTVTGPDTALTGTAPARLVFAAADRCVTAGATCTSAQANWPNWPDVPWDQECTSPTTCTGKYTPSFWTSKRLSTITTQVASGTGTWRNVESWTLGHEWKDPGDGAQKILFLRTLSHAGHVGATTTVPDITFTGVQMANYVGPGVIVRYRISSIVTETGAVLSVNYSPTDCQFGGKMPPSPHANTYRCFPTYWQKTADTTPTLSWFNKYVVTSVVANGGYGSPPMETAYTYPTDGAAWHHDDAETVAPSRRTWGQWRGYDQVTTTAGAGGGTQSKTVARFLRGMHGDKLPSGTRTVTYLVNGVSYNDEDWWSGRTREQTVYNGATIVSTTLSEPWAHGPTATRTRNGITVKAHATDTYRTTLKTTLDGGRPDRVTATTNTFTTNPADGPPGRILAVDDAGDLTTTADDRCIRTEYARNDTAWLHAYPSRVETVGVACTATPNRSVDVLTDLRTFYDGAATFGTTINRGNVTRTEQLADDNGGNPIYKQTSRASHDHYGRVLDELDGLDHQTSTAYTHTLGLITSTVITNPKGWTTTATLEPAWGLPTTTLDVNSKRTEASYDGLGRVTAVWLPGRTKVSPAQTASLTYSYTIRLSGGPSAVTTNRLNTTGAGYLATVELFDSLLRPRQTQAPAAAGTGRILTDTIYDSRGLTVKTNTTYHNASTPGTMLFTPASDAAIPSQNRTTYDGADRPTGSALYSQNVLKWAATTGYGGDRVDTTPPAGATATATLTDARGRTVELRQYTTPTPTGTSYTATRYDYTRRGELKTVTDPAGNLWQFGYDQRGRKISAQDPDAGAASYTYDDIGQLLTSTDARPVTLAFSYDELGRKTTTFHGSTSGPKLSETLYDPVHAGTTVRGQIGKTIRYTDGNGDGTPDPYTTEITGYSDRYQPLGTRISIPAVELGMAGTYDFGTTYNVDGTPATFILPAAAGLAAETLTHEYTSLGLPRKLTGGSSYITDTQYTEIGQLAMVNMTAGGRTEQQYWYHDPATGRPTEHLVYGETTPDIVADTFYSYDPAGNVIKSFDNLSQYGTGYGPDDAQCFTYDHLRRLTEAWTPTSNDCTTARTVGGLGGAAPYWHSNTYNPVGNRLTETRHAAGGDTTRTFTYPAAGTARPHTVTSVATTGAGGPATADYTYDSIGDTRTRPGSTGAQTLDWDPERHLAKVTEGTNLTSFAYTADGERLLRRDSAGTTLYLPGTEIHVNPGGGTPTATRQYNHAGKTIASRTPAGLHWLADDHQGTSQIAIRDSDFSVTRRRQTPFGMPRGTAAAWPNQHSYVGGIKDDATGLTHIGAREYDPAIGRFTTADPIIHFDDPQQMHGYGYANHSPITFADPDGLDPVGGSTGAHETAVWLRYEDLVTTYGPDAFITGSPGTQSGGDLVCWNCSAMSGGADVIWVWEAKSANQGDTAARVSLNKGIVSVRKDPLAQGRDVRPGPMFDSPSSGVNLKNPTQVVTVFSEQPGIELYNVNDGNTRPRSYRGKEQVEAAKAALQRSNDKAKQKRIELQRRTNKMELELLETVAIGVTVVVVLGLGARVTARVPTPTATPLWRTGGRGTGQFYPRGLGPGGGGGGGGGGLAVCCGKKAF